MHGTCKMQSLVRTLTLAPMAPFIVNGPKSYFIMKKRIIKYNKCKGITPTKTHIDCVHPKLLIVKNLQLTNVI
jgi:hypothetical protein